MKHKKITASVLFLILGLGGLHAQEAVPTTGGDATGPGGSSSYSVGQVVYTTYTGTNGSVAQGVQQPYEIYTAVGLEVTEINLDLVAYPNPTSDALTLIIGKYDNEKLTYQLVDLNGKLLTNGQVVNQTTTINMQDYPVSTYLMQIQENNTLLKTFRIVKN
ncbi:MAG: T9SS type A sorting domain-containing protein [Crocinitomicaceae bacterium]|nr:T9SS type A sorting domain-containing protein [Crocinitomicaceae bacterium]